MSIEINRVDLSLNFLSVIAENISLLSPRNKLVVLFPNIRPIRFVTKMLTLDQNLSTEFYTIENFLSDLVGKFYPSKIKYLDQIKRTLLILKLIKEIPDIYKYLGNRDDLAFPWAKRVSSLFEEIDKQMLGNRLHDFQYVEAIDEARKIIENIKTLYREYRNLFNNVTSSGDVYLKALEAIETEYFKNYISDKTFFICGAVYLSNAELKIYEEISKKNHIKFFFHTDLHGRDNFEFGGENYSFGVYSLVENTIEKLKKISEITFREHKGTKIRTKIELHELSDTISEGKILNHILPKGRKIVAADEFGVILPSESSLLPILSQIDGNKDLNITMGYPFKNTEVGILINNLFDILEELYLRYLNGQPLIVTTETILRFLDSSISTSIKRDYFDSISLRQIIYKDCMPSVNLQEKGYAELFIKLLEIKGPKEFVLTMEDILQNIEDKGIDPFTENSISIFVSRMLQPLKTIDLLEEFDINITFIQSIIKEMMNDLYIPFEGDPLKGLQIMGFLESRSISFDTVVFIDMNEGVIPSIPKIDPLLPESIKREIGLSSYEEREQLVRYNFFRTLHSSKTAHILYKSGGSSREKFMRSRFVEQLILMKELENIGTFQPQKYHFAISPNKNESDGIQKDDKIIEKFCEIANNKISSTQLDEYITCPYSFYLKRIKGIKGRINFDNGFDASNVGKLAHKIVEECYKKTMENYLADGDMDNFSRIAASIIDDLPDSIANFKDFESVYAYLKNLNEFPFKILQITLKDRLLKYFKEQKLILKNENIKIIGLEKYFVDKQLMIHGYIDRIEIVEREADTILRIIDYKTGGYTKIFSPAKLKKINLDIFEDKFGIEEISEIKRDVPSLQLPVYIIGASNIYSDREKFEAKIHNLSKPEKDSVRGISISKGDESLARYYQIIKYIKEHMVKSEKIYPLPGDNCRYCEYSYLCKFEKV